VPPRRWCCCQQTRHGRARRWIACGCRDKRGIFLRAVGQSVAPGSSPVLPLTLGRHSTFGTWCPGPWPVCSVRCPDTRRVARRASTQQPLRQLGGCVALSQAEPFEMGTRALPLLWTLTPDMVNRHRKRHFLRSLNKTVLYPRRCSAARCWAEQPCQEHSQPAPAAILHGH